MASVRMRSPLDAAATGSLLTFVAVCSLLVLGLAGLELCADAAQAGPDAQQAGAVSALLPRGVVERAAGSKGLVLQDAIFWNDLVKTLENGRVRILLEDQTTLNVGARSSLRVARAEGATRQSRMELEFGRIRLRVRKIMKAGETFDVTTHQAALGVVGTHFYVRADDKETVVISFEDQVRVRNRNPNISGEQLLSSGEVTTVSLDQPPTPKRRATPEELRQAMEETLPARVARLQPYEAPAGSEPRVVLSASGIDRWPDLASEGGLVEAEPGPCATAGYVSARLKLKPDLPPGVYEFTLNTPEGPMMAAFLVQPPGASSPPIGRMVHAPKVPAGALHRGVVVDEAAKPLAGTRVRIRQDGKESVVETSADGAFELQTNKPGTVELFLEGTNRRSQLEAVKPSDFAVAASRFASAGDTMNVPGVFSSAQLAGKPLALATTVPKNGPGFSTVMLPVDQEEGPAEITLKDVKGAESKHPVLVYRILGGRIDNPNLISGQTTQGEFVVCFGGALAGGQRLNALITGVGFIRFMGEGAQGQVVRKSISVTGQGTARIPFQIQATKGAGPGVPFFINLTLSD